MEKVMRFTIGRVLLAIVASVVFFYVELFLLNGREFYRTQDAFSGAVSRGDQLATRDNLQRLQYFYELNKKLKPLRLDGIANKYFFQEAQHNQSAYDFLTGNYEKIIKDLKDDDSYWGLFMRANAKWRIAQGIFENSLNKSKDEKTRTAEQKQAIEMATSTKDDYEQAIKKWQPSVPWLPAPWNYDLTTNPSAMARALAPKPIKVRVRLGEGGDKGNNPGNRDGDAPGKGTLDLDKKGGDKPSQNPNPGSPREG